MLLGGCSSLFLLRCCYLLSVGGHAWERSAQVRKRRRGEEEGETVAYICVDHRKRKKRKRNAWALCRSHTILKARDRYAPRSSGKIFPSASFHRGNTTSGTPPPQKTPHDVPSTLAFLRHLCQAILGFPDAVKERLCPILGNFNLLYRADTMSVPYAV